jgi:RimJ/RimL family protein N-acetyltransferase
MTKLELVGTHLIIRNPRPQDAASWFRWFADPLVTKYLPLAGKGVLPMESVIAFLETASTSDRPELACAIELREGRLIGCGGYRNFVEHESAELSLILGEPDVWGKGYGKEALHLLLDYGFADLDLKEMWLIVRSDNTAAVGLFRSAGFQVCEGEDLEVMIDGATRYKHKMKLAKESWWNKVKVNP